MRAEVGCATRNAELGCRDARSFMSSCPHLDSSSSLHQRHDLHSPSDHLIQSNLPACLSRSLSLLICCSFPRLLMRGRRQRKQGSCVGRSEGSRGENKLLFRGKMFPSEKERERERKRADYAFNNRKCNPFHPRCLSLSLSSSASRRLGLSRSSLASSQSGGEDGEPRAAAALEQQPSLKCCPYSIVRERCCFMRRRVQSR